MASTITLKSYSNQSRYMKLVCTQTSKDSATNTSTIKWTLSTHGNDETYISTGPTRVIINGTTVYSKDRVPWDDAKFPAIIGSKSGTLTVSHKDDGSKSINVSFSTAIYTSTVTTFADTWELDDISRYGTCNQSLKSKTETSITMNWSSDSTVDYLWYSKDNGTNWTGVNVGDGKSGTYTISGLSANKTYQVKTKIRRKDSQLSTVSSALSVTTYNYPYCTQSPNFTLGDKLKLSFYNPLGRTFKFYIIGNGTQIDVEYNCSGITYEGVNSTETSVPYLYATIPNATSGTYKVKVVYGNSTITRANGNTYSIKESVCKPTFKSFNIIDTKRGSITNSKFLINELSGITVEIPTTNKMVAKNSATPTKYVISTEKTSVTLGYSATSNVSANLGLVKTTGTKTISVRAYDSRSLSTVVTKDIPVYDYYSPIIYIEVKRKNNFGEIATLKVTGEYTPLIYDGVAKNTIKSCKYRYRVKDEDWGEWATLTTTLNSAKGSFTCGAVEFEKLDNHTAFEFEVETTDSLGTITTKTATLSEGQGILFISSNNKKCYSNGVEIATIDNVKQTKYYTRLETDTDLNTIREIGTYRSIQKSDSDTMHNLPSGIDGGFILHVSTWTATETNKEYRRQELIYGRMAYVRRSIDSGDTWSVWNTTAYLEDIYPVGAVYCNSTNTNPASKLGGTWELVDKGFASVYENITDFSAVKNYITVLDSNISDMDIAVTRSGGTMRLRVTFCSPTTYDDTYVELFKINLEKFGCTNIPMGYNFIPCLSDVSGGGLICSCTYEGKVSTYDVIDGTGPWVTGAGGYSMDITFTCTPSTMLDSFCDKFYWRRTA